MENIKYLKQTLHNIPQSTKMDGKKILFVTLRSIKFVLHQELLLAYIYAKNGAHVELLFDDGVLEHWDTYQMHDKRTNLNPAKSYSKILLRILLKYLYYHKNIKFRYLSEITNGNFSKINNVNISKDDESNAVSSVRRFFETGYFDKTSKEQVDYLELCKTNIRIIRFASEQLHRIVKYDRVITSHGIYSLWGTAYNYFKSIGVPIYVYGAHAYRRSHMYFTDTLAQTLSSDSTCITFKQNKILTEEEKNSVKEIFEKRAAHSSKDTSIYFSTKERDSLEIEKKDGVINYCMFPNIIWDGDIVQRDTIFNGMFDWLITTVKYFIKNPQNNLIIRIHPAEATMWKETPKLLSMIERFCPEIHQSSNIYIIDSDTKIDTYEFSKKNVDVALIYDGILCLEMTNLGIPVISPSNCKYATNEFSIQPKDRDEYFEYLRGFDFNNYLTEQKKEAMLLHSYWFFFKAANLMPIYSDTKYRTAEFSPNTIRKVKSVEFHEFVKKLLAI